MARFAFSSPEPTILLACGRNRELWEQPFQACAIDADCVKPDGQNSVISFVISKWLLPELSIPAAGQKDRRLWGRECQVRATMLRLGMRTCSISTRNMSQHVAIGWPNACNMLRPTILRSVVWPELANAWPTMLGYVALRCCYRLAGA